jgi:hypothetical protein
VQLAVVLQASRLLFGRKARGQTTIAGSNFADCQICMPNGPGWPKLPPRAMLKNDSLNRKQLEEGAATLNLEVLDLEELKKAASMKPIVPAMRSKAIAMKLKMRNVMLFVSCSLLTCRL